MKKKEKNKYSFRPIFMIFLLIVVIVVSTYAWFTSNRVVQVQSLELNIQASEGLQISLDAVNWKAIIETNEILGAEVYTEYSQHKNHIPEFMLPYSTATMTDSTSGYMDMFLGTVSYNAGLSAYTILADKSVEDKTGTVDEIGGPGFVAFDLFFKINYEAYLNLEQNSGVVDIGVGSRAGKGIENAARIGFVDQGNVTDDTPLATIQGLRNATGPNDGSNVTIWEPNYLSHTPQAKTEVFNIYGILTTDPRWNSGQVYDGVYDDITSAVRLKQANSIDNPLYFKPIPSSRIVQTESVIAVDEVPMGIILQPGITKMRIYVWLEGQDWDCGDSASGSDMKLDLILTVTRVNP